MTTDVVCVEDINNFVSVLDCHEGKEPWVVILADTCTNEEHVHAIRIAVQNRSHPRTFVSILAIVPGQRITSLSQSRGLFLEETTTIDPILTLDDIERLASHLRQLTDQPASQVVMTELLAYVKSYPDEEENRHIYIVMLYATQGRFEPITRLMASKIRQLRTAEFPAQSPENRWPVASELQLVNFLAVLSSFCPTYAAMPLSKLTSVAHHNFGFQTPLQDLLTTWHDPITRRIGFRHPFLAWKYLSVLQKELEQYKHLSVLLKEVEVVAKDSVFNMPETPKLQLFSDLLQKRWPNNRWRFSIFVRQLIENEDTAQLINFLKEPSCPMDAGHRYVLLSRLYRGARHLSNADESLKYALEAEKCFRETEEHFMSCSNLGEAYGFAAVSAEGEESAEVHAKSMENWFTLCRKSNQANKWFTLLEKKRAADMADEPENECMAGFMLVDRLVMSTKGFRKEDEDKSDYLNRYLLSLFKENRFARWYLPDSDDER